MIWYVNRCLSAEMLRIRLDKTVTEEKKQENLALMDAISRQVWKTI